MFGLKMKSFNFSTIIIYFLVCILLTQSFRLSSTDLDQNESDDARRAIIRRLVLRNFVNSEESSDDNDLSSSTIRRRFCCMHPLSGRKRQV